MTLTLFVTFSSLVLFLRTIFRTTFSCGDGDGVIGGVRRDRDETSSSWEEHRGEFGRVDVGHGVGGGVSGLSRFDKTGNARF